MVSIIRSCYWNYIGVYFVLMCYEDGSKMDSEIRNGLQNELNECREDERSSENIMLQVIAAAGTVLGVIYGASFFDIFSEYKVVLLILNDLVFSAAFMYLIALGIKNVLRFQYMRNLEDSLTCEEPDCVYWMSFSSPITTRNALHIKSVYTAAHYFAYTIAIITAAAFGLVTTYLLYKNIDDSGIFMKIAGGFPIAVMCLSIIIYFVGSSNTSKMYSFAYRRSVYDKKLRGNKKLEDNMTETHKLKKWLPVIIYFLYPKWKDIQKMVIIILGFCTGIIMINGKITYELVVDHWRYLLITIVVVEILAYQARYQLNDIRGVKEDIESQKRNRLPVAVLGVKKAIYISLIILTLKCITAVIIVGEADYKLKIPLLTCLGLILVITAFYEYFRKNEYNRAILFTVSLGYPVRFLAGIWTVYPSMWQTNSDRRFILLLLVSYGFMGAFAAILPWIHEAIIQEVNGIVIKSHYKLLLQKLGVRFEKWRSDSEKFVYPLRQSGKISDPWNISYLCSITSLSLILVAAHYSLQIIILESILIYISYLFCREERKRILLFFVILIAFIPLKGILAIWWYEIPIVLSIYICLSQILFSFIFLFLRCYFNPDFDFSIMIVSCLIWIFKCIIGEDAYKYLFPSNDEMNQDM